MVLLLQQDEEKEKRERTLRCEEEYKRRIARYHNTRITRKKLTSGDLVMCNA